MIYHLMIYRDERPPSPLLAPADVQPLHCHGAVVKVRLEGPGIVVAVSGDIDATNSDQVSEYVHRFVSGDRALIVDFTDIGFLGVQGLRALLALADACRRAGVDCAVVAGQSVHRLLRIVGRRHVLAVASVAEALQQCGRANDRM